MPELVRVADLAGVRTLTLDDPRRRNALSAALRRELRDAVVDAMADDEVRVIVLAGAGGFFCSGGDISAMLDDEQPTVHRLQVLADLVEAVVAGPLPVVAAVEGGAYGAGLSMAAACDHVVAARDARLCASFGAVGLAGDGGIFWSLPQRVGSGRAREMLLFGNVVGAERAEDIGLVDHVVDPGTALEIAQGRAAALAARSRPALSTVKSAFVGTGESLHGALARESRGQRSLFDGPDLREGVAAFQEKRTPTFRA